ncbi:hypothetical protein OPV22_030210 [Ensete ventricosum]|uniref:Uncharacterized protein n=1 Tax=Ensete ventricosum TaxID=4639 RepID=A0AAV8QDF5_ENSVE|nr:hypothetical protein OPV22_030210 [Ensete ventricosum]
MADSGPATQSSAHLPCPHQSPGPLAMHQHDNFQEQSKRAKATIEFSGFGGGGFWPCDPIIRPFAVPSSAPRATCHAPARQLPGAEQEGEGHH